MRVHRTVHGRPQDGELLISPPGTLVPGGATVFAETDGERVRFGTATAGGAVHARSGSWSAGPGRRAAYPRLS